MLARRLALVAALAALLALVVFLVMRDDGAIERGNSELDQHAPSPRAAHVDLASAPDTSERAAADAHVAETPTTVTQPIGRTFADLVRPLAHRSQSPLDDTTIVCTTVDGVQRRVRGDDAVLASDLEPRGLWIITAPHRCPRIIDPEAIALRLSSDGALPIDVELMASATLTLHFEAPLPEIGGIERVVLTTLQNEDAVPDWLLDGEFPQLEWPWSDVSVVDEIDALADGSAAPAAVAEHVERIRATRFAASAETKAVAPVHTLVEELFLWSWRYFESPDGTSVVLEHIPAERPMTIGASGGPLVVTHPDGTPIETRADRYTVRTTEFQLVAGESREFFVRQVAPAVVRGRLPAAALANARIQLAADERARDGRRRFSYEAECYSPSHTADGSFEWPVLDAGFYEFTARWEEPGGVHRRVKHEFEIVAGEVHDLGELQPAFTGRLTIHTRLEHEGSLPPEFGASTHALLASVMGPIDEELDPLGRDTWGPAVTVQLDFDEPYVLDGIEPGMYRITLERVRSKSGDVQREDSFQRRTDDTHLLSALRTGSDARLVHLTNAASAVALAVDADTVIEVVAEVALAGACTLEVPLPAAPAHRVHNVLAQFIRGDGLLEQRAVAFTIRTAEDGAKVASLTTCLPPGEWVAIVVHMFERSGDLPAEHRVARHDFTVVSTVHTTNTVTLDLAARLRVARESALYMQPLLVELADREAFCARPLNSATGSSFDGLLPHTRYRFGERVIETGGPGSEVVLE